MSNRIDNTRKIKSPHGNELSCKSWATEAPMRMLMNNLDAEVAEKPHELVVYGGIGRAARNWGCFDKIVGDSKRSWRDDETLLVQSGKPVGRLPHPCRRAAGADRQLQPGAALGDNWDHFQRARPQGRTDDVRPDDGRLLDLHRQPGHRPGHLRDLRRDGPPALWRRPFTGKLDPDRRARRHGRRPAARRDHGRRLDAGGRMPAQPHRYAPEAPATSTCSPRSGRGARHHRGGPREPRRRCRSACSGNAAEVLPELVRRGVRPDAVTDQTSAARSAQRLSPARLDAGRVGGADGARPRRATIKAAKDSMAVQVRAMLDVSGTGRADLRLRQQHPPNGLGSRASRTPSSSPASCRPTSVRSSAAASARSAGRRSPAIRRTSTRPTPRSRS